MLINELTEKRLDPLAYKDDHRQRLMDKIRDKSEGKTIVSEEKEPERAGDVVDIMEALRRSLEGGGRAPAKRRAPRRAEATRARRQPAAQSRKRRAS